MAKSKKRRDGEASLDGLPAGRNEPKTAPMSRTAVVTKPKKKSPKTAAAAAVGSSNWSALATRIGAGANPVAKKRKQERLAREESEAAGTDSNGRDAGEGAGKHRGGALMMASTIELRKLGYRKRNPRPPAGTPRLRI